MCFGSFPHEVPPMMQDCYKKYLKENYAQLYFLGFGLFGFLVVFLVAIEVLKGRAVIPDNLLGFIVLVMFAYFFFQFWANMASHITEERK